MEHDAWTIQCWGLERVLELDPWNIDRIQDGLRTVVEALISTLLTPAEQADGDNAEHGKARLGRNKGTRGAGAGGASDKPKASKPLKPTLAAVLDVIRTQPKGKGISGKGIIKALKARKIHLKESTLRRHYVSKLKESFGVVNCPAAGGYLVP